MPWKSHLPRFAAAAILLAGTAYAQLQDRDLGQLDIGARTPQPANQIVARFAAREKEFAQARDQYTYHQVATVETVSENGAVNGDFRFSFDVTFDDQGTRIIKNEQESASTLKDLTMTQEDKDDIRDRLPFVLTTDDLPEYNVDYVGQQNVGERPCFVFNIAPKSLAGSKRYFQGKVWVDAQDFQIIRTFGKAVPDIYRTPSPFSDRGGRRRRGQDQPGATGENLFPSFTTYRAVIDGKYWFPVRTYSYDTLFFSTGERRIREIVQYSNYKRFGAQSKILYEGKELPGPGAAAPATSPTPQTMPDARPGASASGNPRATPMNPAGTPAAAAPSPAGPQDAQGIQRLMVAREGAFAKAYSSHERGQLDPLLGEAFEYVNQRGDVLNREDFLSTVAASRQEISVDTGTLDIRIYGETVIVIGRQEAGSANYRFTHVYVFRGGGWQLVSAQLGPGTAR